MQRAILNTAAVYYLAAGVYMLIAPQAWYDMTPGVSQTGPLNIHLARDIALIFLASAAAMIWGAACRVRPTAVAGVLWPCLHALFHLQMWLARGLPADQVAAVNLTAIQLPTWLALWSALTLTRSPNPQAQEYA